MRVPWSHQDWKKVAVYGLGASGLAAIELLRARDVDVVGLDRRSESELDPSIRESLEGIALVLGREPEEVPEAIDGLVVSPGVPPDRPLVVAARHRGLPVVGEVELASIFLNGPLVAITGSNGKSTTTALTGALLEAAGFAVEVCGNIGPPLSSRLDGPEGRVFVVELSSFQLETAPTLHPKVAALLNVSADHLDWHGSFDRYLAAKTAVFSQQTKVDLAVLNADDPVVRDVGVAARRRFFSRLTSLEDGCFLDGESVVEVEPGGGVTELFQRSDVSIAGAHNLENAMAAALVARGLGASRGAFPTALASFGGLPHRMELVATIAGVQWINDSKGTNVGATAKSLDGFSDHSVHLILGGRGKGTDFSQLAEAVSDKVVTVYLIGESGPDVERDLPAGVDCLQCGDLARAVGEASTRVRSGHVVVLSPACASFDQYANYEQRGEHFRALVEALPGGEDG